MSHTCRTTARADVKVRHSKKYVQGLRKGSALTGKDEEGTVQASPQERTGQCRNDRKTEPTLLPIWRPSDDRIRRAAVSAASTLMIASVTKLSEARLSEVQARICTLCGVKV